MRGAEGARVTDGVPYRYPLGARDALLRALRRAHAQFGCPRLPPDIARFFNVDGHGAVGAHREDEDPER